MRDLEHFLATLTRKDDGNSLLGCVSKRSSTGSMDGAACLPGSSAVELASGATVRMDAPVVGDVVRVAADAVSPIIRWCHGAPAVMTSNVPLVTVSAAIDETRSHSVSFDAWLVSAADGAVNHRLDVVPRDGGASHVQAVSRVVVHSSAKGFYLPDNLTGDSIVHISFFAPRGNLQHLHACRRRFKHRSKTYVCLRRGCHPLEPATFRLLRSVHHIL